MLQCWTCLCAFLLFGPAVFADEKGAPTATSPDRQRIATADGKAVNVTDAATGRLLLKYAGHTGNVTALAFSPDGKLLISAGADQTVRIMEAATGKEIRRIAKTPAGVTALAVSVDGKTLTASDNEKKLASWDLATGRELP